MNTIRNSICLTIITMVLCGFLFPLAITLIGQIFFYQQANGSLITYDNRIVGSKLIGQHWTETRYFHGRPSAVDYNMNPEKLYKTAYLQVEVMNRMETPN